MKYVNFLNRLQRSKRVKNIQIILVSLVFAFGCESINSQVELKGIKLGVKDKVENKVMMVNDAYFNFNTLNLKDGRSYTIVARSINKRNGSKREVSWEEIDKLIVFFENKYEIELKPFGGVNKAPNGDFSNKANIEYIPDGYKAIKNDIEYRINGAALQISGDKFPFYYLAITDLNLKKIYHQERKQK